MLKKVDNMATAQELEKLRRAYDEACTAYIATHESCQDAGRVYRRTRKADLAAQKAYLDAEKAYNEADKAFNDALNKR